MNDGANETMKRGRLAGPMVVVAIAVAAMSLYANAILLVGPASYVYFPPFQRGHNPHDIGHLGAEYNNIAAALLKGRGFADPFRAPTGPTAWMPPMFSWVLTGLRWDADGDLGSVKRSIIILQDLTLIATGWLVIGLARRTASSVWLATAAYVGALAYYFHQSFQFTHDCWIVLAALDVLVAGLAFFPSVIDLGLIGAAAWGLIGGLLALTSPAVAFIWGLFWCATAVWAMLPLARRTRSWQTSASRLGVCALAAGLTVSPWIVRNYLVFGRFIPIKSNLPFELYQSQCVQEGGVLHDPIFQSHPNNNGSAALREYARLGEMAFMDRKWEQFVEAVRADPADFLERTTNRFLEATFVYIPFNKHDEARRPWLTWVARLIYPLPFVCLVGLVAAAPWRRLRREQWIVIGVYLAYLMPYVVVSYYDRYKFPLMGLEAILVIWGAERFLILRCAKPTTTASRLRLSDVAKPQAALEEIAR